jgi:flagellin-like protein
MYIGTLLRDDDAVSPVIGVILMVGITVTLAAVIGVFVLGASATTSVPDAEFRYVAEDGATDGWGNDGNERFVIQHDGGEDVDASHVTVQYAGSDPSTMGLAMDRHTGDVWEPGEKWVIKEDGAVGDFDGGQQVLVLWTTADGSSSQILESGDLP